KQKQTAIDNLNASLAKRGIVDPAYAASGAANIANLYDSMSTQHQANFANQAQQQKMASEQALMQYLSGLNAQGTQAQEAGAGGQLGVGNSYQNSAQMYQNQQNMVNNQFNQGLGDLLNIASFGLGGGFGNLFGGGGSTEAEPSNPEGIPQ